MWTHLVVKYSQWLVGGEVFQFGFEDDGVSSPACLDHLLPILVIQAAFVLDQAEHAQVLTHVPSHRPFPKLQTLYGRPGGTQRAEGAVRFCTMTDLLVQDCEDFL